MIEAFAVSLYIYAAGLSLATPAQQQAAWQAQPVQMQQAFRREADFILSRGK